MDWSSHMTRILDRLGEDATWRPAQSASTATVRVMFVSPYSRVLEIVAGSRPQVAVMASAVPELGEGDVFELRSTDYRVVEIRPDPVSGLTVCDVEALS